MNVAEIFRILRQEGYVIDSQDFVEVYLKHFPPLIDSCYNLAIELKTGLIKIKPLEDWNLKLSWFYDMYISHLSNYYGCIDIGFYEKKDFIKDSEEYLLTNELWMNLMEKKKYAPFFDSRPYFMDITYI